MSFIYRLKLPCTWDLIYHFLYILFYTISYTHFLIKKNIFYFLLFINWWPNAILLFTVCHFNLSVWAISFVFVIIFSKTKQQKKYSQYEWQNIKAFVMLHPLSKGMVFVTKKKYIISNMYTNYTYKPQQTFLVESRISFSIYVKKTTSHCLCLFLLI